jgi:hypothetical protein
MALKLGDALASRPSPMLEEPRMNVTTAKTEAEMEKEQGVCHTVALPFTLKKNPLKETKFLQVIITLL